MATIKINTREVCAELNILIALANENFKLDKDLQLVRFLYDGEHCMYEKNEDYLFRPIDQWKLIGVLNRPTWDHILSTGPALKDDEGNLVLDDEGNYKVDPSTEIDRFIKSKVLQWCATVVSRNYVIFEFEQSTEQSEEFLKKSILIK